MLIWDVFVLSGYFNFFITEPLINITSNFEKLSMSRLTCSRASVPHETETVSDSIPSTLKISDPSSVQAVQLGDEPFHYPTLSTETLPETNGSILKLYSDMNNAQTKVNNIINICNTRDK